MNIIRVDVNDQRRTIMFADLFYFPIVCSVLWLLVQTSLSRPIAWVALLAAPLVFVITQRRYFSVCVAAALLPFLTELDSVKVVDIFVWTGVWLWLYLVYKATVVKQNMPAARYVNCVKGFVA